ncbi:DUF2470 domain-containing protein [Streptomyces sp. SID3343]|uniref:DUF2470 domain-containing protein n=1 Tax=Streptomyces sp. SID3343 TaxID=2690260 RepID=UPI001369F99A|nr:DUF2470 domain-containing protein [Streptomyces sp. SID3343]
MSLPIEANAGHTDVSARRPVTAARARTLAAHATSATLDLPGDKDEHVVPAARVVESDGSLLLLVPGETAALVLTARDDLAAVLHLVDVAPVAVPHRVRAHCWIAGWLTIPTGDDAERAAARLAEVGNDPTASPRAGTVVRMEVGEVLVDDLWGAGHVEPEDYADAEPDPLAADEAELLQHLAVAHAEDLGRLASVAGAPACAERVAPVSLDRHGLRLRTGGPDRTCDIRFEFDTPVSTARELGGALRRLLHGAHGDA